MIDTRHIVCSFVFCSLILATCAPGIECRRRNQKATTASNNETTAATNPSDDKASSTSTCGTTKAGVVFRRIVGGRKALKYEFPYQVALEHRSFWDQSYRQFCGASIIADRWILTAAHCVTGENVDFVRAVVGVIDLRDSDRNVIQIEKAIPHEGYNSWTVENDVALLKTKSSIRQSTKEFSNTICLPSSGQQFNGSSVITGFGTTKEGGSPSQQLLSAPLEVLPDSVCNSVYSREYKAPGMLCAGVMRGGRDSCQGDSGGPLAVKSSAGYTLAGITSYGRGCARVNTPGVYTRVSNYVDWINDKMRNN